MNGSFGISRLNWTRHLGLVVAMGIVLTSCSAATADPALVWTDFGEIQCADDEQGITCHRLEARVDGSSAGEGSCAIVALGKDDSDLWTQQRFGPLALEPGAEFAWEVELPEVDDPRFDRWYPACSPEAEG